MAITSINIKSSYEIYVMFSLSCYVLLHDLCSHGLSLDWNGLHYLAVQIKHLKQNPRPSSIIQCFILRNVELMNAGALWWLKDLGGKT